MRAVRPGLPGPAEQRRCQHTPTHLEVGRESGTVEAWLTHQCLGRPSIPAADSVRAMVGERPGQRGTQCPGPKSFQTLTGMQRTLRPLHLPMHVGASVTESSSPQVRKSNRGDQDGQRVGREGANKECWRSTYSVPPCAGCDRFAEKFLRCNTDENKRAPVRTRL